MDRKPAASVQTERAGILDHLTALQEASEKRFEAGNSSWDPAAEEIRAGLLARLARLDAHESQQDAGPGSEQDRRLTSSNRRRASELATRTEALLASWLVHREDLLRALGQIREGRKVMASYLNRMKGEGALDVKR